MLLNCCPSCSGPRPSAARRCPWCLRAYDAPKDLPEHLYASFEGESEIPGEAVKKSGKKTR